MTQHDTLVTAFRALTAKQRARLLAHAKKGTRICCRSSATEWIDGYGGG